MMTKAHSAYRDASIATASPARLLVMLVDRLVLDIQRGAEALRIRELETAHAQLTHAQDIVMELQSSLKADAFTGGRELAALYGYLHQQLVTANIRKDLGLAEQCLDLAEGVAETWRQAAMAAAMDRSA